MKLAIAVILVLACHLAFADQVGKVCTDDSSYWDGKACTKCPDPCIECVYKNSKVSCTNCGNTKKFLKFESDVGTCTDCIANCDSCRGPTAADCIKPSTGYTASAAGVFKCDTQLTKNCITCGAENNCSRCEFGYRNNAGNCEKCTGEGCAECSAAVATCSKCSWGYSLDGTACKKCDVNCKNCPCTECNPGYFFKDGACTKCTDANCAVCSKDAATCATCNPMFYLDGTACKACGATCLTCSKADKCESCMPDATVKVSLIDGVCVKCPAGCNKCNAAGECLECQARTAISADKKTCVACPTHCATCDNAGVCSACDKTTFLSADKKACTSCSNGCEVCTSATECQTCLPGFNTDSKKGCKSLLSCKRGEELDGAEVCKAGTIDNCAFGNTLTSSCFVCGDGYYAKDKTCNTCGNGCAKCSDDGTGYIKCDSHPQAGISVVTNTNAKLDKTGYLGQNLVATVDTTNVPATCMPSSYKADFLLNPLNRDCVAPEKCTHPYQVVAGVWGCHLDGKNAAKVAVSIFAVVVAALFTL